MTTRSLARRPTVRAASLALALLLPAACATPTITRTETLLTPKQIADMGLECREVRPPDSNISRMICATPDAWARDAEREANATETLIRENIRDPVLNRFTGLRSP